MTDEEKIRKGQEGESDFKSWLDGNNIGYVAINQTPAVFANLFKVMLKGPTFSSCYMV